MKKRPFVILLSSMLFLSACGTETAGHSNTQKNSVESVLQQRIAEEGGITPTVIPVVIDDSSGSLELTGDSFDLNTIPGLVIEDVTPAPEPEDVPVLEMEEHSFPLGELPATDPSKIDIDLTTMNATMTYSTVFDMMSDPFAYTGQIVKMKGTFSDYYDESTDTRYLSCIIKDATACCAQGLEFETTKDFPYPDAYPANGEEICVEGYFDTYLEGNCLYCVLRNAVLLPDS